MHKAFAVTLFFIMGVFFTPAQTLWAAPLSTEEKLSDLGQLVATIKSGYGPLKFKETELGLKLSDLVAKYEPLVRSTRTNREFYYLMVQFVAEFKDSHFGARIPTNHRSRLPFSVDLVEGKVLLTKIDREKLPEAEFPFEKGDELISMDGQPVEQIIDELSQYVGQGFAQTTKRVATFLLVARSGSMVPVKEGLSTLIFRRGTTEVTEEAKVEWIVEGEPLDEYDNAEKRLTSWHPEFYLAQLGNPNLKEVLWAENNYLCSGETRIAIPKDATIIMKKPFVAYYHPSAKGNIGYLRIPHYYPENEHTGEMEYELRLAQYRYAVHELEKNTVGLVIDQDHNCGGSVRFLEQMLGLFVPGPFKAMQFQFLATKSSYLEFMQWLEESKEEEHTIPYQNLKSVAEIIKKAWQEGKFMTEKTSFSALYPVFHDPEVRYTRPVLMLIDELSGSGGDAFPAYMQGLGRAKLFGTRTMGAGGHVTPEPSLNYSGIKLHMTKSLFYRPDGVAVENNGAVPDYSYSITRGDLMYEYKPYQKAYLKTLLEMIP